MTARAASRFHPLASRLPTLLPAKRALEPPSRLKTKDDKLLDVLPLSQDCADRVAMTKRTVFAGRGGKKLVPSAAQAKISIAKKQ